MRKSTVPTFRPTLSAMYAVVRLNLSRRPTQKTAISYPVTCGWCSPPSGQSAALRSNIPRINEGRDHILAKIAHGAQALFSPHEVEVAIVRLDDGDDSLERLSAIRFLQGPTDFLIDDLTCVGDQPANSDPRDRDLINLEVLCDRVQLAPAHLDSGPAPDPHRPQPIAGGPKFAGRRWAAP